MTMHLIKLAVGPDSLAELAEWQAGRLKEMRRRKEKPELMHVTRQTPKRGEELLDGGSIYWVIKGMIAARQKLCELRPVLRDGVPHCALILDEALVRVAPRPVRAFQGWRYLAAKDAPPDVMQGSGEENLPENLRRELALLGLL